MHGPVSLPMLHHADVIFLTALDLGVVGAVVGAVPLVEGSDLLVCIV